MLIARTLRTSRRTHAYRVYVVHDPHSRKAKSSCLTFGCLHRPCDCVSLALTIWSGEHGCHESIQRFLSGLPSKTLFRTNVEMQTVVQRRFFSTGQKERHLLAAVAKYPRFRTPAVAFWCASARQQLQSSQVSAVSCRIYMTSVKRLFFRPTWVMSSAPRRHGSDAISKATYMRIHIEVYQSSLCKSVM